MVNKMKTIAATAALATAMMLSAQAAHAVTISTCTFTNEGTEYDVSDKVSASSACYSFVDLADGDDAKLIDLNTLAINGTTGGWTPLGKFQPFGSNDDFAVSGDTVNAGTDDEAASLTSGTWSIFDNATSVYSEFLMIFKAASANVALPSEFVGFILSENGEGAWTGIWESPFVNKNNPNLIDLSNVALFARGDASVVPLPAAGWLLLMGLGGLGVASRRKRKAQVA